MKGRTTTQTDENVATVVRMLIAAKRGTPDEVAEALGMSRSTVFDKLNGKRRWYAEEVSRLAQFFELPITTFYEGPGGVFGTSSDYWPYDRSDQWPYGPDGLVRQTAGAIFDSPPSGIGSAA